jgi:hypothetical protein
VIADTELGDIWADFRHDPRDLVAKHGGCREYRVGGEEHVSVTQPGGLYVDQNFAAYWLSDVHVLEIEWTTDCVYDKRLHVCPPYVRADFNVPKRPEQEPSPGALAVSRLAAFPESA